MTDPPCTLDSVRSVEQDLLKDLKTGLGSLGPTMLQNRIATQEVFAQSSAAGGPSDQSSAIQAALESVKLGIRELSRRTGVRRKVLLSMIEGRCDMPQDVFNKIYAAIQFKQPTFFDQAIAESSQGGQ